MDLLQEVQYSWTKYVDQRVTNLLLIESSYQVPLIILAYIYIILSLGPRFMKNRQPYSLKTFIKFYNIIQIVANAWLAYDFIDAGLFTKSELICPRTLDYSYSRNAIKITRCLWYFFLLKILDYVETGVFILRKKNNQVSNLHIYHHVSTLFLAWFSVRYFAVAPVALNSFVNSCIHVIMYTYYFLAAWGPNIQKTIAPMKRWITIAQMVQMILLMLYVSQYLLPSCKQVPYWMVMLYVTNLVINFFLFYNFYQKAYNKPKRKI